jgi:hypothetical protein
MLRDMWEAMIHLHRTQPDKIQRVSWFAFADGFSSNPTPGTNRLEPIRDDDDVSSVAPPAICDSTQTPWGSADQLANLARATESAVPYFASDQILKSEQLTPCCARRTWTTGKMPRNGVRLMSD